MIRFALACCVLLAACENQAADGSVRILSSTENTVVLRGWIDATRTRPPERYDTQAGDLCGRFGKKAVFVSMAQRSTFGFDVTYNCVAAARA